MKCLCKCDLIMSLSGIVDATKGVIYDIEKDGSQWRFTDNSGCQGHYLDKEDLHKYFEIVE